MGNYPGFYPGKKYNCLWTSNRLILYCVARSHWQTETPSSSLPFLIRDQIITLRCNTKLIHPSFNSFDGQLIQGSMFIRRLTQVSMEHGINNSSLLESSSDESRVPPAFENWFPQDLVTKSFFGSSKPWTVGLSRFFYRDYQRVIHLKLSG